METKTLSERIAKFKEINEQIQTLNDEGLDFDYSIPLEQMIDAEKIIDELRVENQVLLSKNGELESCKEREDFNLPTFVQIELDNRELAAKNRSLQINSDILAAANVDLITEKMDLQEKVKELENQIEEEKLKTFVHQADANCGKRNHESDKIFYRKCLKNVRAERDSFKTKNQAPNKRDLII